MLSSISTFLFWSCILMYLGEGQPRKRWRHSEFNSHRRREVVSIVGVKMGKVGV